MPLRPYQEKSVQECLSALAGGHHPVLSLPTGSGKSVVLAALCKRLPGRILVATHRKELLEQDASQLELHVNGQFLDYGIYSAGLSRREDSARIIFGGIASVYRRMDQLQAAGDFAYVIVDESHLCPPPSVEDSMYSTVFAACPTAQRIGLTATPYRLNDGAIYDGGDTWFDTLAVHVGIRDLTPDYLSPLVGVTTAHDIDVSQVRSRMGEFVTSELSQSACEETAVKGAVDELLDLAALRQKWLIFCVDVAHTTVVHHELNRRGIVTAMVTGETKAENRADLLRDFREGKYRAMTNCLVMTTGFDIPDIDCIALMRPSQSKGLIIQQIGRGTRRHRNKSSCLVLDFAGAIDMHAPLDELSILKQSPQLQRKLAAAAEQHQRAERERLAKHGTRASLADPMGDTKALPTERLRVLRMAFSLKVPKRFPHLKMLQVLYFCATPQPGRARSIVEFVCLEHEAYFARHKAREWFSRRGVSMPQTALHALRVAHTYPIPREIVVTREGQYAHITIETFD